MSVKPFFPLSRCSSLCCRMGFSKPMATSQPHLPAAAVSLYLKEAMVKRWNLGFSELSSRSLIYFYRVVFSLGTKINVTFSNACWNWNVQCPGFPSGIRSWAQDSPNWRGPWIFGMTLGDLQLLFCILHVQTKLGSQLKLLAVYSDCTGRYLLAVSASLGIIQVLTRGSPHPLHHQLWLGEFEPVFQALCRICKGSSSILPSNAKHDFIEDWKSDFLLTFKPFTQHKYKKLYLSLLVLSYSRWILKIL